MSAVVLVPEGHAETREINRKRVVSDACSRLFGWWVETNRHRGRSRGAGVQLREHDGQSGVPRLDVWVVTVSSVGRPAAGGGCVWGLGPMAVGLGSCRVRRL